jgi:acetoin utilization deacetylase AcuC-like enzyme
VHHGNGTQDYFYERPDVLFFSAHRYPFYPGTGAIEEMGAGKGMGYTVNVPLPAGVGDEGYERVFDEVLVPLARRYRPQLILISAGFDAHLADPLGGMAVTTAGYYRMAKACRALADGIQECQGRVAAVLEGGYNTHALAMSVLATIVALRPHRDEQAQHELPAEEWSEQPTSVHAARHRPAPDIKGVIRRVKHMHNLDEM